MIHCDGACSGNPGPGGYGVVLKYFEHRKELSGGFRRTTNNRMELLGAIVGLESVKKKSYAIKLVSDSKYLVNAVNNKWLRGWKRNGWRTKAKEPVKNIDLWRRLDALLSRHEVELVWIKGHAGEPENERCDQLAVAARDGADLPPDDGYEALLDAGRGLGL